MEELLKDVRSGDRRAQSQLFQNLRNDRRVARTIQSLSYESSVVESEDVKAEFWRGVLQGVAVVRHDLGDPVLHLIQRGVWQVKSVVRTEINKRIVQHCSACGRINSYYSFARLCEKCKSPIENVGRSVDISDYDFAHTYVAGIANCTTVQVTRPLSRVQCRVLELLVQACLDGSDAPQSDIARVLGVSRERIRQHLAKIKPHLSVN